MYKYNPLLNTKFNQMAETLYKDIFTEVYNKLHSELLSNVKLGLAVDNPVAGQSIFKKTLVLSIPENEHVVIYHTSLSDIAGIIYTNVISPYYNTWSNCIDLMTNDNLTIDIKTKDGIVIPHSSINLKSSLTNNNTLYISIDFKTLSDLNINYKQDLYITMYVNNILDDNNNTKKHILCYNYRKNNLNDKLSLLNTISNDFNTTTENIDDCFYIYINGYLYKKDNYLNIINNINDDNPLYIDYIQDYNIKKSYKINLNSINNLIYNDINNKPYVLLHTNKYILNKSIYTLDTIDIYIFNISTNEGLFIPTVDNEDINQIDAMNISISLDYLNTFIDKLRNSSSDNFVLEIKYRTYNKDNKLDYNSIYTYLLHKFCGDSEIKSIMLSQSSDNILNRIYDINYLQSSIYSKTLYKLPDKDNYFDIFNTSINTYGFYRFCQKYIYSFYTIRISNINIKTYTLEKSLFYKNEYVYLKVYKNKILLNNNKYTFTQTSTSIDITINDNISVNDLFYIQILPCDKSYNHTIQHQLIYNLNPDNTSIEMQPNRSTLLFNWLNSDYRSFTVDNNNNKLTISFDTDDNDYNYDFYKFDIYLKESIPSDTLTYLDKPLPYRYTKIDNILENDYFIYLEDNDPLNKSFTYIFKPFSYNKTFIIVPNNYYTLHIKKTDISLDNDKIISLELKYDDEYIVDIPNISCYLNGHYLYNKIDYDIIEIKNNDNTISGYILIIQNYHYSNNTNNNLDIYISTIDKIDISREGYGIENAIVYDNEIIYNDNEDILEILIDGNIYNSVNKQILANAIVVNDYIYNLPYEVNYIVPSIINKNYHLYNTLNNDDNYIINKMLKQKALAPFNTKLMDIDNYKISENTYATLNNTLIHLYPYSISNYFNIFKYLINTVMDNPPNDVIEIDVYDLPSLSDRTLDLTIPYRYIISSYLIYIINKIINNELFIDYTSDDNTILNILSPFNYLKQYDIIFQNDNKILSYRYLIYPDIDNATSFTSDINKINMIKRIIEVTKPFYIIH